MRVTETASASNWKLAEIRRDPYASEREGQGRRGMRGTRRGSYPRSRRAEVNGKKSKGEIEEKTSEGKRNLQRFHAWRVVERARPGLLVARKAAASRLTASAHYTRRERRSELEHCRLERNGTKKEVARAERDGWGEGH